MSIKTFKISADYDISDGYHTFNELYEHRNLLFLNLCLTDSKRAFWKPDFEGWFVVYLELSSGQISYHIQNKYLSIIEGKIKRDDSHLYDEHQSQDVVFRLTNEIIQSGKSPI